MTVIEYKKLLGVMYRQTYYNDKLIGMLLIEVGRAINRLLEDKRYRHLMIIKSFECY